LIRKDKDMKAYYVRYLVNGTYEECKGIQVPAHNKAEAYDIATYELIPQKEGRVPYASWVSSVTYNNGNVRYFNTCDGLAY